MGAKSREKRKRRFAQQQYETDSTPISLTSNLITIGIFLVGLYTASFGVGICTTNRWGPDRGYLSPHPWTIPVGAALVMLALWLNRKSRH